MLRQPDVTRALRRPRSARRSELQALVSLSCRLRDDVAAHLRRRSRSVLLLHRHLAPDLAHEDFADQLAQSAVSVELARSWFGRSLEMATNDAAVADFLAQMELLERSHSGPGKSLAGLRTFASQLSLDAQGDASGISPLDRFLQDYLQAFNPAARRCAGVYFTPAPIASFIVEGLDQLLQREFRLRDGLADTSSWQQAAAGCPGVVTPRTASPGDSFVQVLDPATGTGAFLIEVIDRVHRTMQARWESEGLEPRARLRSWNGYVRKHLLPRLHGFELLMALHLVARLALEAKLADTGYALRATDRLSLWRVDALTLPERCGDQETRVRATLPMTVMLGNPPFSGGASHAGPWIEGLMEDYKTTIRAEERQIQRLSNQYVRFLRLIEWKAQAAGCAAIGLITDRGYLDGVLFRDVRQSLLRNVQPLHLVDLGGASTRGGKLGPDDNVFDITQPVAILLGVWRGGCEVTQPELRLSCVQGSREQKLEWLRTGPSATRSGERVVPHAPAFRFRASSGRNDAYATWTPLLEVFGSGDRNLDRKQWMGTGIKTRHDRFAMGMTAADAVRQVRRLALRPESDAELMAELHLCTTAHFDIQAARQRASEPGKVLRGLVRSVSWRPLDQRFAVWCREFICEPKERTMRHLLQDGNVALAVLRRDRSGGGLGSFVARGLVAKDFVSNLDDALICPLFVDGGAGQRPNLNPGFVERISKTTGLAFDPSGRTGSRAGRGRFNPSDLLGYIYAILWSPRYRSANREALCNDFPRLPLTHHGSLLLKLAQIGSRLCRLHLLDAVAPWDGACRLQPGTIVQRVHYDAATERAHVSPRRWVHVPSTAWNLVVGTHPVLESWLTARRGRRLRNEDIEHLLRAVQALVTTVELAEAVDDAIACHGGWSRAFEAR